MYKAIYLQFGAAVITAIGAGLIVGTRGLVSVGLAAIACILPNLFFAVRLTMLSNRPGNIYAANFFIGEFLKIGATIGLLAIAIKGYPEMHWPSLLIGFAIVLHAGFIAFWKKP
ncbi:ATP synthase subunit I [Quatrionicoccus australiensis]|jgi:ATP synthase protein I|uniref:ATP synthase subunit I n=1 Tax=Quatrionicoccus australiensis TaxID=138118 RepID=UPI001CF89FB8|nr:ATP synthase subunit I [Quatrionicoccus australiensis]UCV15044.1 ATP synthase subunit I [Quatrionicoccus australiensis]